MVRRLKEALGAAVDDHRGAPGILSSDSASFLCSLIKVVGLLRSKDTEIERRKM